MLGRKELPNGCRLVHRGELVRHHGQNEEHDNQGRYDYQASVSAGVAHHGLHNPTPRFIRAQANPAWSLRFERQVLRAA